MPSFQNKLRLDSAQQKSQDSSEYILALMSGVGGIVNYPAVAIQATITTQPCYIEKIHITGLTGSAGPPNFVEIYMSSASLAPIIASASSSFTIKNKNTAAPLNSQGSVGLALGEITPGDYNALVFGEDLFRKQIIDGSGVFQNPVIDLSNSNIILQATNNPAASYSIICVMPQAGARIFTTFEYKQFVPANTP